MKTLYFLFVYFLCFIHVFSQNKNYATHRSMDDARSIVSINNKSFYTQYIREDCCSDLLVLTGIVDNFTQTWSRTFVYDESNYERRLIATRDKHIAVLGYGKGCDVWRNKNFFAKVDTLGALVFEFDPKPGVTLLDFTEHADSSYFLASSAIIYHYSKNGQYLSEFNAPFIGVNAIQGLLNGNLLIAGNSSMAEVTPAGFLINLKNTAFVYTKFEQVSKNKIAAWSSGNLMVLDSALNIVSSVNGNFTVPPVVFKNIAVSGGTVFVTGYNSVNATPFFAALDTNLTLYQPLTSCQYKGIVANAITLTSSKMVRMATTGKSGGSNLFTFSGLYEMPLNGSFSLLTIWV